MPWLTITAGSSGSGTWTGDVQTDGAEESAPTRVGETVRAFDGTLRSTVRSLKRAWRLKTAPMSLDALETFKSAIGLGPCTISGAITRSASVAVHITRGVTTILSDADDAEDTAVVAAFEITEV